MNILARLPKGHVKKEFSRRQTPYLKFPSCLFMVAEKIEKQYDTQEVLQSLESNL